MWMLENVDVRKCGCETANAKIFKMSKTLENNLTLLLCSEKIENVVKSVQITGNFFSKMMG
jgi:hypothetical protein